jgi:hypothetical protein
VSRGIPYGAMLAMGEDELADTFPFGAMAEGNRYWPAREDEEPKLTRDDLLKRRKELQERARIMPTDSSRPPLRPSLESPPPRGALGATTHGIETPLGEPQEPEPERVDEETEKRFTAMAHSRFAERQVAVDAERVAREDVRRFAAYYKSFAVQAVRCGVDPTPMLVDFQRQIAVAESQLKKAS